MSGDSDRFVFERDNLIEKSRRIAEEYDLDEELTVRLEMDIVRIAWEYWKFRKRDNTNQ